MRAAPVSLRREWFEARTLEDCPSARLHGTSVERVRPKLGSPRALHDTRRRWASLPRGVFNVRHLVGSITRSSGGP